MEHKDAIVALKPVKSERPSKKSAGSVQEAIDTCLFFQSEGRRLYGQTVNSELARQGTVHLPPPARCLWYHQRLQLPCSRSILEDDSCHYVWKHLCVEEPTRRSSALLCSGSYHARSRTSRRCHQLVHGKGSGAGQYLVDAVDEGRVNKISFTGSTEVGKMIGEVCGRNLVSCSLELGGKEPSCRYAKLQPRQCC